MDFSKNDMKNYMNKAIQLNEENKRSNERINLLEKNMNCPTNKDRANNVVIYKVPGNEQENKNLLITVKNIITSVNTNISTESVIETKRLGKQEGSNPILVTLNDLKWKTMIFEDKKALGHTN